MWELIKDVWTLWSSEPGMETGPQPYLLGVILSGLAGLIGGIIWSTDSDAPPGAMVLAIVVMTVLAVLAWPLTVSAAVLAAVWFVFSQSVSHWVVRPVKALWLRRRTVSLPTAIIVKKDD